ncbi:MFS transporter [Nonomuraea jabiensis]|uniref:MFS family permease n=1 Tax=Nonomuraea jabiensis TaxID=882448 RepID=A0A7W9G6W2_9ACTN|nr:MFS transporter [Nonomuraea jabiensis]MBB5778252.1 MFS family permease [Nonomuraea jabiensis]
MSHHRAIAAVFVAHGAVAGSLSTRIPWIQEHLHLTPGALGLALLCPSIGAFVGMPMASRLAYRFGNRAATRVLLALWCAGLALPALSPSPVWLFGAFLLFGAAAGMCDVAMNAHAVLLERHLGRSIMSGLHGMWSVGSLAAGGLGALAAHAGIDARIHLGAMSLALLGLGAAAGRGLLPDSRMADSAHNPPPDSGIAGAGRGLLADSGMAGAGHTPLPDSGMAGAGHTPLPDSGIASSGHNPLPDSGRAGARRDVPAPRRFALPTRGILVIGLVGFCATFAEGASSNWSAVYLTAVTAAGPGLAAAGYTVFMLCMASTRLLGDHVIRRIGPVATVRAGGAVAAVGGALVVAARTPALGIAGFALVGLGIAVIVPLVIAAAGNAGTTPGEGVAGVATITYLSGLIAPAVTGWVAGALGYPTAFALITCVVVLLTLLAPVLRPSRTSPAEGDVRVDA